MGKLQGKVAVITGGTEGIRLILGVDAGSVCTWRKVPALGSPAWRLGSRNNDCAGSNQATRLVGIHLNWQFVFPEQIPKQLSFEEKRAVEGAKFFLEEGNGYFREQSTRPQTVGYCLADSPAGQALWIYVAICGAGEFL